MLRVCAISHCENVNPMNPISADLIPHHRRLMEIQCMAMSMAEAIEFYQKRAEDTGKDPPTSVVACYAERADKLSREAFDILHNRFVISGNVTKKALWDIVMDVTMGLLRWHEIVEYLKTGDPDDLPGSCDHWH